MNEPLMESSSWQIRHNAYGQSNKDFKLQCRGQKRPIFGLEWRKQPLFRLLRLGASWRVQGEVQLAGSRFAILSLITVLAYALCGRL